ncbi:MAG: CcmD family protein [Bacteroidia bacterium]|jgi:hypothetical protein|nr:CcmD family protein [Bacteroidia bacterium]
MQSKIILLLAALLTPALTFAQGPEMADLMRSNGKIYVVVVVVCIVFAGITAYLIRLDKKISKFEKYQNTKDL